MAPSRAAAAPCPCGSPTASSSAARTALRPGGAPLARQTSRARESRTSTVGVRRIRSRLTSSRWDSASTSTCRTPGMLPATSARIRRVALQGAQNAVENCNSVARASGLTPSATSSASTAGTAPPPSGWAVMCADAWAAAFATSPFTTSPFTTGASGTADTVGADAGESGRTMWNRPSRSRMNSAAPTAHPTATISTHNPVTTVTSVSVRPRLLQPCLRRPAPGVEVTSHTDHPTNRRPNVYTNAAAPARGKVATRGHPTR